MKRFMKKINGSISKSYNKIRITTKKDDRYDTLVKRMKALKNKDDKESKDELEEVLEAISEVTDDKANIIKEEIMKMKSAEGKMNPQQLWKLRKRLCPKSRDPPCAMMDSNGNLLTSDDAIENEAIKEFSKRLKGNEIVENLKDHESTTNELRKMRLERCKLIKSDPCTMDDLKYVLKQLETEKSRDADGFANEVFKEEAAGDDLLLAVLKMMNRIKEKQKFPKLLQKCNITCIHKKKSKKLFVNYRGVFRVCVLRSILNRLMYNESYSTIDANLTDGNVGARKQRSCRDNIFVISAITNSVIRGTSNPIQAQVMDVDTCFDKLWLQSSINALYEAGLNNDTKYYILKMKMLK